MDELKQIYRQALPARIAALEAARADGYDAESVRSIQRLAHALRGSGGTYGFPEISAAAATVEGADADAMPDAVNALLALLRNTADAGSGP